MRISPISFNNSYSRNNNRNINKNINNNKVNNTMQQQNNKNISFGFFDSEIAEKIARQILTAGPRDEFLQHRYDDSFQRLKDSEYIRIYTGPDKTLYVEYDEVCLIDPYARKCCDHHGVNHNMLPNEAYVLESIANESDQIREALTKPILPPTPTYHDYSERLAEMLEGLAK